MNLSIIIPVYKTERYVEKCLRSCAEQDISSDEYEIIVVNDGSPDRSLEVIERVSKEYPNIIVVSQENHGQAVARNLGLSIARGDYIWFVDSDDWIEKNCLKRLLNLCVKNQLDILHFCPADVENGKTKRRFSYENKIGEEITLGKDLLLKGIYSSSVAFSIYKREFLLEKNLLFLPGIFHEDSELGPRANYLARRCMVINDVCYYVFQNPNSTTRIVNPKKAFDYIKVCESLDKFSIAAEKRLDVYFHNLISMYINESLLNSYFMNSKDIKDLNAAWGKFSYLFKHLRLSSKLKYRLEYYLFRILPFYCQIYKLIQHLNRK